MGWQFHSQDAVNKPWAVHQGLIYVWETGVYGFNQSMMLKHI